ncbi:MAG: hypothetical protein ACJKTH_00610 [Patescibacteria group bacterium UBA2163]
MSKEGAANDNLPKKYHEGHIRRRFLDMFETFTARANNAQSLEEKEFWQTRAFKTLATLLLLMGVGSCTTLIGDFSDN